MKANFYANKLIVITGGASGLGAALISKLLVLGAKIVCIDSNNNKINDLKAIYFNEIKSGKLFFRNIDVTDQKLADDIILDIWKTIAPIDILINSAGILIAGEIRDMDASHFRDLIDVNLMGVIYISLPAYKLMTKRSKGSIINIASISGISSNPLFSAYSSSKHAVIGFSKAMREEGEKLGVSVTVVCPSTLRTNMQATGKVINAPHGAVFKDSVLSTTPAEIAAELILKKLPTNPRLIIFPFHAKIFWILEFVFPWLLSRINQKIIVNFRGLRNGGH